MSGEYMKKRRNLGYTLAELLMTVAIITIISAFGFVEVIQHQYSLKLTEMDNIAREIFVGAQNHLTADSSTWENVYHKYADDTAFLGDEFTPPQYEVDTIEDVNLSSDAMHDFHSIAVPADSEEAQKVLKTTALQYILPFGSVEETIRLGGNYIVEYDAYTGSIYGVFYAQGDSFDEKDVNDIDDKMGRTNEKVRRRYEDEDGSKKKYAVGYYGGAESDKDSDHSGNEETVIKKPTIEVLNEERLILAVTDPNNSSKILGAAITRPKPQVTLYQEDSGDSVKLTGYDGCKQNSDGSVTYYYILDSIVDAGKHFAEQFQKFTPGKDVYAEAVLDYGTSDRTVKAKSKTFNSLYAVKKGKAAYITNARHLANLSTEISSYNGKQDDSVNAYIKNSIIWHSSESSEDFFDKIAEENSTYFDNDITGSTYIYYPDNTKADSEYTFYGIVNSTLRNAAEYQNTSLSYFTIAPNTQTETNAAGLFTQLSSSTETIHLTNFTLNNFTIQNVGKGESGGSLLGATEDGRTYNIKHAQVNDVTVTSAGISGKDASAGLGGLVGSLDGNSSAVNITGSTVTNPIISGKIAAAGGMVGLVTNSSSLKITSIAGAGSTDTVYSEVINPRVTSDAKSNILSSSGGLIGRIESGDSISVTNVSVIENDDYKNNNGDENETAFVIGNDKQLNHYAGGMISNINQVNNLMIENCAVRSQSGIINSYGYSAGGLIGRLDTVTGSAKITNSYSSVDKVKDTRSTWARENSSHVNEDLSVKEGIGGFIGLLDGSGKVTISNCYSAGRTTDGKYNEELAEANVYAAKSASVGGFIGYIKNNVTIENCFSTCSVGSNAHDETGSTVNGTPGAGGFIGQSSASQLILNNNYSTGLVTGADKTTAGTFIGIASSVPTSSSNTYNYVLNGVNSTVANVCGDGKTLSNVKTSVNGTDVFTQSENVETEVYDTGLAAPYPFNVWTKNTAGNPEYHGDWPVPETDIDGEFGIIYYEIVQHGEDKNSRDYYYHGYMGNLTDDVSASSYKEVNTAYTNSSALNGRPHNDHGLLTGHNEYVVEEGYIVLISKDYTNSLQPNQKITVEIGGVQKSDGNNSDLIVENKCAHGKLGKYSDSAMEQGFKMKGYSAYVINQDCYVDLAFHSTSLEITNSDYYGNNRGTVNAKADFSFQPMFSDTLSQDAPSTEFYEVYKLRSAQELKYMFEKGGNSSTEIIQNHKAPLEQNLDISYDSNLVHFTKYNFEEQKTEDVSAQDDSYLSAYCEKMNFATTYTSSTPADKTTKNSDKLDDSDKNVSYKLDGLNRTFIKTLTDNGVLKNVYVQNTLKETEVDCFIETIENTGSLLNSTFYQDYYNYGAVKTNKGTVNKTIGKKLTGNHFVYENISDKALISETTITDSIFSGAIIYKNQNNARIKNANISSTEAECFVYENFENNSVIDNVHIENAKLAYNSSDGLGKSAGFARTSEKGSSIINCSIAYSTIGNFGFIYKNEGYVSNCYVANSTVETRSAYDNGIGSGFAYANNKTGTIDNCQVYATVSEDDSKSVYQQYEEKYSGHTLYYEPHRFTISDAGVEAADESDSQIIQGYDLMTVGMKKENDKYSISNNKIGGFVYNNYGTIKNSSFTGSVYAKNRAGGFAYNNMNSIDNCYANAYVYGINVASGFTVFNKYNDDQINGQCNGTINASHALGTVSGNKIGTGFVTYLENGSSSNTVTNCYTAVWKENVNKYYPFYDWDEYSVLSMTSNYVMTDVIDNTDTSAWATQNNKVSYLTDEEFKNETKNGSLSNLGSAMPENTDDVKYTVAYSSKNAVYPYPMPKYNRTNSDNTQTIGAQLTAYGDWRMKGVFLSESSMDLYVGDEGKTEVTVIPEKKTNRINVTVDDNNQYADVTYSDGILHVKGKKAGKITVTVAASNANGDQIGSAELTVNVYDHSSGIEIKNGNSILNGKSLEMNVGDNITLSAAVQPETANQHVKWNSSNPNVVSVSQDGTLTALSAGTVTITVSALDKKAAATFTVNVIEVLPEGISIKQGSSITIKAGDSQQLNAVITPENATDQSVSWTSSDASIVSVDNNGNITGVKEGTAKVTAATVNGKTAVITVTVTKGSDSGDTSGTVIEAGDTWEKFNPEPSKISALKQKYQDAWFTIPSGTLIQDDNGTYVLVYGNQTNYSLANINSAANFVNQYPNNAEIVDSSTKIAITPSSGFNGNITAGTIAKEGDSYYVAIQAISWNVYPSSLNCWAKITSNNP